MRCSSGRRLRLRPGRKPWPESSRVWPRRSAPIRPSSKRLWPTGLDLCAATLASWYNGNHAMDPVRDRGAGRTRRQRRCHRHLAQRRRQPWDPDDVGAAPAASSSNVRPDRPPPGHRRWTALSKDISQLPISQLDLFYSSVPRYGRRDAGSSNCTFWARMADCSTTSGAGSTRSSAFARRFAISLRAPLLVRPDR